MILGMSVAAFTLVHVIISLVGIATGIVVALGMLSGKRLEGWTALFLFTTVLTSVTGFFFHSAKIGPPHIVGALSLVLLAVTILALYVYSLAGAWRWIYVVGAFMSEYLNCFVGVVQSFQKIPALNALAPQGNEPPFLLAQLLLMAIFIVLGIFAVKRFHPTQGVPAFA